MLKRIIRFLLKFSKFKKTFNNCPCYDNEGNFIGWFSRSVAVTLVTFFIDKDKKVYVLASKRGKGTPDPEFVGSWNVCCGYLDFNETCKQAAVRETFEETGESTMFFRIADNSFVQVNGEQLKAIKKAIILKGQELYQKKWQIETSLVSAKTFDEIMAIKVEL